MSGFTVTVKVGDLRKLIEGDKARAEKDYAEEKAKWDEEIARAREMLSKGLPMAGIKVSRKPSRADIERLERMDDLLRLSIGERIDLAIWEYNCMRYEGLRRGGIQYAVGAPPESPEFLDLKQQIADEIRGAAEA